MSPPIEVGMLDLWGYKLTAARGMLCALFRSLRMKKTRRVRVQHELATLRCKYEELQEQLESGHDLIDDGQILEMICVLSSLELQMDELEQQIHKIQDVLRDYVMKIEQLERYIQECERLEAVYEDMHRMHNPRNHTMHDLLLAMYEFNRQRMLENQYAVSQLHEFEPQEQRRHELHFQAMYELHRRELCGLQKAMDHCFAEL